MRALVSPDIPRTSPHSLTTSFHSGAAPIVNPAMLPTGYAGCFACLHAALERVPRCPVTLVRVAEGDLRRVLG